MTLANCSTRYISNKNKFPAVPSVYLTKCEKLELLKEKDNQIIDLINVLDKNASIYLNCKEIHNNLVNLLEKRIGK